MDLMKVFTFDAAHRLTAVPPEHKCAQLHGHTFRVEVYLSGPLDPDFGWLIDFAEVKRICEPVIAQLDHRYLNDIDGLGNPTSENIARWLWRHIENDLPLLEKVAVYESPESGVSYRGEAGD